MRHSRRELALVREVEDLAGDAAQLVDIDDRLGVCQKLPARLFCGTGKYLKQESVAPQVGSSPAGTQIDKLIVIAVYNPPYTISCYFFGTLKGGGRRLPVADRGSVAIVDPETVEEPHLVQQFVIGYTGIGCDVAAVA